MRLGTVVVAVCWAEQMEMDNKVARARATMVLKRRIEAPWRAVARIEYFRRERFRALAHKEKCGNTAPQRAKDLRAALPSVGPGGKASLLLPLRETISGYHAEVPCLNS